MLPVGFLRIDLEGIRRGKQQKGRWKAGESRREGDGMLGRSSQAATAFNQKFHVGH